MDYLNGDIKLGRVEDFEFDVNENGEFDDVKSEGYFLWVKLRYKAVTIRNL